ncbi:hypothetical protein GCK72_021203 [Caenorhabditis remanei]|uniref:DUF38 domain-containing protein n=1 Tax=Caenorhabditis remanei TaxID=31234 RepID=E3NBF6_CAERE|nr:hypothetical protein GCK72_021203 [Caenorhabditis remanei]EFO91972.1 hypothetical protein CRE_11466 [Caenorhabditis remanei]KAF1754640.1 hypothetical protein GCK72_021203 [Caenorhabditis remanei]
MESKASKNQSKGTKPPSTESVVVLQQVPIKPLTKPLTYPSMVSVVEFISFGRRKQLYAKCPTIRKLEERLPYHLERMEIQTIGPGYIILRFENVSIGYFGSNNESDGKIAMWCSGKRVKRSTGLSLYEATEKFALYNLSRPGTTIKTLETKFTPKCILNCIPLTIENYVVDCNEWDEWIIRTTRPVKTLQTDFIIRHDTIKYAKHVTVTRPAHLPIRIHTDILSEWNCESITIERKLTHMEVLDYCRRVSKRTDRLIGSVFKSKLGGYSTELFEMLSRELNARKITLKIFGGGLLQFATIHINESTELVIS